MNHLQAILISGKILCLNGECGRCGNTLLCSKCCNCYDPTKEEER